VKVTERLPDVQILTKAVHDALVYQEFFSPQEVAKARNLLKEAERRVRALEHASAPWTTPSGHVVQGHGHISRIDGSVQPYGVLMPPSYSFDGSGRVRLYVWFHVRGETRSAVNFLDELSRQPGQFTPADTIVLHPYSRYCNANKFAGEVDVLEAI
jgi:hypothetical protein